MTECQPRIGLTHLPPRSRQLKPEELQNVFGGCVGLHYAGCQLDSDCCPGGYCDHGDLLVIGACFKRY